MQFIIEHLEDEVYDWCILEYSHISSIVGKEHLLFTNVPVEDHAKLKHLGEVTEQSVQELKLESPVVLDPASDVLLTPADASQFKTIIIGGILGNFPQEHRTQELISSHLDYPTRSLGDKQMSTNTAVYVAKKILDGKKFEEFEFADELVIPVEEGEEVILPYRYVVENGNVVLPEGYEEMAKKSGF